MLTPFAPPPTTAPPAIRTTVARHRIDDYLPLLEKLGWKRENIAAITLSPSTQSVVIAAPQPGKRRITDETDLYRITWEGKLQRLTTDTGGYGFVFFSSDEAYLGYLSREGAHTPEVAGEDNPPVPWTLYVHNLHTGVRRAVRREAPLPPGTVPTLFGWLPTMHGLLYSGINPPGLFLFHADGLAPTFLTPDAPTLIMPDWRHAYHIDSKHHSIVFTSIPTDPALMAQPLEWRHALSVGPFGMPDSPDFTGLGSDDSPAFSPDGSRVAMFSAPWGWPLRQLCVIELGPGTVRLLGALDPSSNHIVWSPDGKRLIGSYRVGEHNAQFAVDVNRVKAQSFEDVDWSHPAPAILEAVK
jgi:hypothetical protein